MTEYTGLGWAIRRPGRMKKFGQSVPPTPAAPTAIGLSATSIASNAGPGSVVALISADGYPSPTFAETADPDGKFTVSDNQLLLSATPGAGPHSVTITATNASGSFPQTFSIAITAPAASPNDRLVAFSGQSNAMAQGTEAAGGGGTVPADIQALTATGRIKIWDGTTWVNYQAGVNSDPGWTGNAEFTSWYGLEAQFAVSWLAANPTGTLYIVKYAVGATRLIQWRDGQAYFEQLQSWVNAAKAATSLPLSMFSWDQGESDANIDQATIDAYRADLISFIATEVRTLLGNASTKVVLSRAHINATGFGYRVDLRFAQNYVAYQDPLTFLINQDDYTVYDNIHTNAVGVRGKGARVYDTWINGTTVEAAYTPNISSANSASGPENASIPLTLVSDRPATWTITGGADAAKFSILGNTLTLAAQDYENPADAGANNTYVVQVTATDAVWGTTANQTITFTVSDAVEGGAPLTYNALSATDHGSNITIAGNAATSTADGFKTVRANKGSADGLFYWEVAFSGSAQGFAVFGVATQDHQLNNYLGVDTTQGGGFALDGGAFGLITGTGGPAFAGASGRVRLAVDFRARLFWMAVNGGNWNNDASANPASGVGGKGMNSSTLFKPLHPASNLKQLNEVHTYYFDPAGWLYSAPTGFLAWTDNGIENVPSVPVMTANNLPSGHVASASSEYDATFAAWKAFDGTTAAWNTTIPQTGPWWVQRQLPSAITIAAFRVRFGVGNANEFLFQGSNDGSTWTTLHSQGATVVDAARFFEVVIDPANRAPFSYYRLYLPAGLSGVNQFYCREIQLLQAAAPSKAYTYLGTAQTAVGVTSTAVDIGAAAADRLIVVGVLRNAGANPGAGTFSVAGTNLTLVHSNGYGEGFNGASIYAGIVPAGSGSQTIAFPAPSTGNQNIFVWSATGLSSATPVAAASNEYGSTSAASLSVQAGDFIFAIGDVFNFNGSTETFTNHFVTGVGAGGDLTVATTNAAFSVAAPGTGNQVVAAAFR